MKCSFFVWHTNKLITIRLYLIILQLYIFFSIILRNTDTPRAIQVGAAHSRTTMGDRAWKYGTLLGRCSQRPTLPCALQQLKNLVPDVSSEGRTSEIFFPDMPCMKKVYRARKASVHWSAAGYEDSFSSW